MMVLSVVTPPPGIYHGFSIQKKFWEHNFTLVKIIIGVRRNIRKHRDIKNGEQYIILDISSKLDCLYKRKVTY